LPSRPKGIIFCITSNVLVSIMKCIPGLFLVRQECEWE
jgi:hypothetical protein